MTVRLRHLILPALAFLLALPAAAQGQDPVVASWLKEHQTALGLSQTDISQWVVTSETSDKNGTHYIYIQQQVNGLPVRGAVANFALHNGRMVTFGNRMIKDVAAHAPSATPGIRAADALKQAAKQLGLSATTVRVTKTMDATTFEFSPSGIASAPIKARLVYQPVDGEGLKLAWDLSIRSNSTVHWWDLAVDATSGKIIRLNDRNVACRLPNGSFANARCAVEAPMVAPMEDGPPPPDGASYRVFALPVQAPSFGPRTLLSNPADVDASPYGWHDTNGIPGAEYTITRGNNVYASDDIDNDDLPGFSPDGEAGLSFDYTFTQPADPVDNLSAAITNLFYMCNALHDIWYQYGFDEVSGNFQATNYTGAGEGNDEVLADAQDGGGVNNANFGTPDDGESGRMQMYTWSSTGVDSSLVVNSPASVDGPYDNVLAGFGPPLPTVPLTADVVLVQDDVSPASDGCDSITNGADLVGKIALVDRGICTFISKVQALQDAGAVAVIVINNQSGASFAMSGSTGNITIPAVMISQGNGIGFKNALQSGPVNATLQGHNALFDKDGDFDNGVIAHEYGHGVSTRLTGGPANSDCLYNDEQMGEGWSDWMALMVTMEPGDQGTDARGIGTYVIDEPTTGLGIRPAPYSTDLSVNDYTYGDLNNQNIIYESHDIGFLWATMTWDMTWALVNAHGFSADIYHGNGGNNIAMRLMIDGLKLQPCSPGFVDGRNAILEADTLDFGGADACLIWNAFARRGLGYSADEGSSFSRFDQTEAFDLPPGCDNILSVGEHHDQQADFVSLVPNPAQELVTIGLRLPLKDDLIVYVYSAEGRSVLNGVMRAGSTTLKLDISSLAPGSYQVDLRGPDSAWHRSLIVVR